MVESRAPGTTSSATTPDIGRDAGIAILTAITHAPILTTLVEALGIDAELHIVGGTVRQVFESGVSVPTDLDLATKLRPDELHRRAAAAGIRTIETGIEHGTLTALVDGAHVEVTTFRKPGDRRSSAFSDTIEEDLGGRDFTFNAIAFSVAAKTIIDPHGGLDDLRAGVLRAVGTPADRFGEDPLRILRMVRFGPARGRSIDPATSAAAVALAPKLKAVSVERIRDELDKILLGSHVGNGLRALRDLGLLPYTVPELAEGVGFEQNEFHTEDVFAHIVTVVANAPADLRIRLAALFHDIGKPRTFSVDEDGRRHFYNHERESFEICKSRMRALKYSNDDIRAVSELVRLHMWPLNCGPSGVRRLIRDLGDLLEDWKTLKRADSPPVMERREFDELLQSFETLLASETARLARQNFRKLAVTGDELIAAGLKSGPRLGTIIKELENVVIENPDLNTREELTARALEMWRKPD